MARLYAVATPADARGAAQNWDDEYLDCRIYGHQWQPSTADYTEGRRYIRTKELCRSCEASHTTLLDASTGIPLESKISAYPEGYLLKGKGRMGREARGALRLEQIDRRYNLPRLKAVKRGA